VATKDKDRLDGIKECEKEIRSMSAEELRREFRFVSSPDVNLTKLIRSLIWQAFTRIRDRQREPIGSNIRGFWYTDVKPVLSRLGLETQGDAYTEKMYDALLEMVTERRLFNYADMGFIDDTAGVKLIGKTNVGVIVFVEKDGLFPIVEAMAKKYDCVGVSTGGYPSILASEYLVRGISRTTRVRYHFDLYSIVDYDPNGAIIEKEFSRQLSLFEMKDQTVWPLINPDYLSAEQIGLCRYRLASGKKTDSWMAETGGVNGEAYGIEANAFTPSQIEETFLGLAKEKLRPVEETPGPGDTDRLERIEGRLDRIEGRFDRVEEILEKILEGISGEAFPK